MEESLISNREQSRHTDSRSADIRERLGAQAITFVVPEGWAAMKVLDS